MKSAPLILAFSVAILGGAFVFYWRTPEPPARPADLRQSPVAAPRESASGELRKALPVSSVARDGTALGRVAAAGAQPSAPFAPHPAEVTASARPWAAAVSPAHGPAGQPAGAGTAAAASGAVDAPAAPADRGREYVDFLVPVGAILPAAMMESPEDELTAPQMRARELMARDFLREVPPLPTPGSPRNASDYLTREQAAEWNSAREKADQQYRILFGEAALNARNMAAAREALAEK